MTRTFTNRKISREWKANPGTGSQVVAIPFVPEIIQVEYLDSNTSRVSDTVNYDIAYVGNPGETYRLTVNWAVMGGKSRRLRYTVAALAEFSNRGGAGH